MKVHTTVGVYNNDSFVVNGVLETYLKDHVEYNLKYRPGRAFFVDGKCLNEGYLSKERIENWERRIKSDPKTFVSNNDSKVYL